MFVRILSEVAGRLWDVAEGAVFASDSNTCTILPCRLANFFFLPLSTRTGPIAPQDLASEGVNLSPGCAVAPFGVRVARGAVGD